MMIATKQTATLEQVEAAVDEVEHVDTLAGKALAGRGPTHA
jgi:hypothetical protein